MQADTRFTYPGGVDSTCDSTWRETWPLTAGGDIIVSLYKHKRQNIVFQETDNKNYFSTQTEPKYTKQI